MKRLWFTPVMLAGILAACGDDVTAPIGQATAPVLDSISPEFGTSGTEVQIFGGSFSPDSTTVYFGDVQAPRVIQEGGSLFAIAPAGLTAGTRYDVRVVNDGSAADTIVSAFEAIEPRALRVNGVSKPTGLIGMTVIVDGEAFGDSLVLSGGRVFFLGSDGSAVEAAIADSANDWADGFAVTTVPEGTADSSYIWVETVTGVSDSIEFTLIESGVFSPASINWTETTSLTQPLQGLGAVFVPGNEYVFTIGGADTQKVATTAVYRNSVAESGALGPSWTEMTALPEARAYHATAAATAYTAALDTQTTAGYLYAIGGRDDTGTTVASVWFTHVAPDGGTGSWQETTPLPEPLHSAGAVLFRGFMYVAGGIDANGNAVAATYRAKVNADGTLGEWESMTTLPQPAAYFSLVSFGPYIYAVGGETVSSPPVQSTLTNTETASVHFVRLDLRDGTFAGAWQTTSELAKARSKHSTIFAGGSLLVTSGIYAGFAGSSENAYAVINSDGTLGSWQGATGAELISSELGYSLYNQAMITFIDDQGNGHVLVLGGARRDAEGVPSAGVVYY